MFRCILLFLFFVPCILFGQQWHLQPVNTGTDATFRGLSVVDNAVAWVSGTKGFVGVSDDKGQHWHFRQVRGYENCDFRTIYAFDANTALIANAGSPAVILRTDDGGANWQLVYKKTDSAAFIDGMDFWNKRDGLAYGDPLHTRMLLLRTEDGGNTWKMLPDNSRPVLAGGEASFAASGTCIKCIGKNKAIIATGGKVSRLLVSEDRGSRWHSLATPIVQGENSTGIFSFSSDDDRIIIAGGDYLRDTLHTDHIYYSQDGGRTWRYPSTLTRGYRECLADLGDGTIIACGPGGLDISIDNGLNWQPLSDEKDYHVIRKARNGNWVLVAGGKGKMAFLVK